MTEVFKHCCGSAPQCRLSKKVFLVCVIPELKLEGEMGSRWLYHLSLGAVLNAKAGAT